MTWQDNAIMHWSNDGGVTWNKISDHNREPLSITTERFEKVNRTVDGTMRRYTVAKKRTFSVSWSMFPGKRNSTYLGRQGITTVDNGFAGEEIEAFFNANNGLFKMKLRKGIDEAKATADNTIEVVDVMFTDFSKDIEKRGTVDLWSLSVTMEEV